MTFTNKENTQPKKAAKTKIDRRKHYIMMLDVETAGGLDQKLVYDFGFAIADKQGNIYEERSFVIEEIFSQTDLMNSAYYSEKLPLYHEGLETGKFEMKSFFEAREIFLALMNKYNVKTISAYNLNFDMSALSNTFNYLLTGSTNKKYYFLTRDQKEVKLLCTWSLACETIFQQKTFKKMALEHGQTTPAGNYKTSAEVAYRYIKNNWAFVEEHTGLADVRIEVEIMAKCFRQKKKTLSGILSHPWRLVVNHHGKVKDLI